MPRISKLIFSSLAMMALASCGGGGGGGENDDDRITRPISPSEISFRPHLDDQEKITFVYPENWERRAVSDPEVLVAFAEPPESRLDRFLENVLLIKVESISEPADSGDIDNIEEISNRELEVAGFPAIETIFDADVPDSGGLRFRFMQIAFEFNGSIYALLYTSERKVFPRNREIVRHMASQMAIGQITFDGLDLTSDLSEPGSPGMSSDGQDFLVVSCRRSEEHPYPSSLIGMIVHSDRSQGEEFLIDPELGNFRACGQAGYSVIFDGINYLVVYTAFHDGYRRVVARRITKAGMVLDNQAIDISANTDSHAHEPAVVFDGNRSLIAWHHSDPTDSIRAAFIDPSGSVTNRFTIESDLDASYPTPTGSQFNAYKPLITLGDNQYMVVWSPHFFRDVRQQPMPIYGQLLDLSGNLLLAEKIKIRSDLGDNPRYVQVASDGNDYLVAWIEGLLETNTIGAGSFTVYARQISSSGELDSASADDLGTEIAAPELSGSSGGEVPKEFLRLSFINNHYLFLWTSTGFSPSSGVYAVRASRDLQTISAPTPAGGTGRASYGRYSAPYEANSAHSSTQTLLAWPSSDGVVQAWLLDDV